MSISEDTILYALYPPPSLADEPSCLSLAACIHDLVPSLLPDFLWHRDPFQLKIANGEHGCFLDGRMRVGDAIDDEWCAVWLLREISKRWDVVISVSDSDGEFLLIEAAESLPRWVNPSNATNRVWIYGGRLHLIPLSHVSPFSKPKKLPRIPGKTFQEDHLTSDEKHEYIAINDALPLPRDASVETLAPKAVEDTVWKRISGYPAAVRNHVHTTMAYLPLEIARALAIDRSLVQKPIETFYTRDAIHLRAAHRMTRFPPRPDVLCRVQMTRTAYAQLLGQKFYPPKIFGAFKEREGTATWRWRDIGMKLACGFEMLFQESKNQAAAVKSSPEILTPSVSKDAARRSLHYKAYLTHLTTVGYFRDQVEGSQLWNELETKAADIYTETRREDDVSRPSFATLFNAALSRAPESLPEANLTQEEDSDGWMSVDTKDFNEVLEHATRTSGATHATDTNNDDEEDSVAKEQTDKLRDLAAKVGRFVEGHGDAEGVRFEDEAFSDEDVTESDDEDLFSDEQFSDSNNEETDGETQGEKEAARQRAMNNLVPALPASEYGQMPASLNTQRVAKATILAEQVETRFPTIDAGVVDVDMGQSSLSLGVRPIRPPLLPRDKYEGVDSDDESSSSDLLASGDEEGTESDEDKPQVVGEMDVDMNEEQEEFLEFSRQALGISDDMWDEIIRERQRRGAFVPASMTTRKAMGTVSNQPAPDTVPTPKPKLDSFEAVMQAMDDELLRLRQSTTSTGPVPKEENRDKARAAPADADMDMDIEASMQAELDGLLEREQSDDEGGPSMDYNLIKNFLESFKSQAGLPGPVSNLATRLQPGWTLPRDS